jgi:hypothetical protein
MHPSHDDLRPADTIVRTWMCGVLAFCRPFEADSRAHLATEVVARVCDSHTASRAPMCIIVQHDQRKRQHDQALLVGQQVVASLCLSRCVIMALTPNYNSITPVSYHLQTLASVVHFICRGMFRESSSRSNNVGQKKCKCSRWLT